MVVYFLCGYLSCKANLLYGKLSLGRIRVADNKQQFFSSWKYFFYYSLEMYEF